MLGGYAATGRSAGLRGLELFAVFNCRATILFATPGGPSRMILSPARAARSDKDISVSFS